jgi:hypothetical protein
MSQRKYTELWNELVDEADEDENENGPAASVAQTEAELKAAGFDVAAERAKANAFLEELGGGAGEPTREPIREGGRRRAVGEPRRVERRSARRPAFAAWLAAAATLGAVAGGLFVEALPLAGVQVPSLAPSTSPTVRPSAADLAAAADLRREATAACDTKQWSVCLADLDRARTIDPGGDDARVMQHLRDEAIEGILK